MSGLFRTLGNIGTVFSGADQQQAAAELRKRQQAQALLQQAAIKQQMAQRQQQMAAQQAQVGDANTAAAMQMGLMRGGSQPGQQPPQGQPQIPQQVAMPGAQPMPQGQPPMGGPRPIQGLPGQQTMGMSPRPMSQPQPGPQRPPQAPQQPAQGGGQQGGGMSLEQAVSYIDQNYANAPDRVKLEALNSFQNKLSAQAQAQLAQLKEQREAAHTTAEDKAKTRELDISGQRAKTGDRMADIAEERAKTLRDKAAAPPKQSVAQWKYKTAQTDVNAAADNIEAIVKAHPNAVGAYGKIYKGIGSAYGVMHEPEPADAEAAQELDVQFQKLTQALGVAGGVGGLGGSTFSKQWENTLGDKSIYTNPQKVLNQIKSLRGDVAKYTVPAGVGDSSEAADSGSDIDALVAKYAGEQ